MGFWLRIYVKAGMFWEFCPNDEDRTWFEPAWTRFTRSQNCRLGQVVQNLTARYPFSMATSQINNKLSSSDLLAWGDGSGSLLPPPLVGSLRRSPLATGRAGVSWFVDASLPSTLLQLAIDGSGKEARGGGRLSEGGDRLRSWFEEFSAGCFGFRGDLRFWDSKVCFFFRLP